LQQQLESLSTHRLLAVRSLLVAPAVHCSAVLGCIVVQDARVVGAGSRPVGLCGDVLAMRFSNEKGTPVLVLAMDCRNRVTSAFVSSDGNS
jgi:hypothetical protein